MTVGVFCMCFFVQYDFIFQVASFGYWIFYLIFLLVLLVRPLVSLYE